MKTVQKALVIMAVVLMLSVGASAMIDSDYSDATDVSGTDGSITWTLTGGTLTLTATNLNIGFTSISDHNVSDNTPPWYTYRDTIYTVVIQPGITSIGQYAFYYLRNMTSVTIPDSVAFVHNSAFYWCTSLTSVTLPDSITSMGVMRSIIAPHSHRSRFQTV